MEISKQQVETYYYGNPEFIGTKILLIKREERLVEYKQQLTNACEFGNVWRGLTGLYLGQPLTVIATGIGPSLTGDAIYALNRPDAICLYSGTCGGLQAGIEIGDYCVADQAQCGDGYSLQLEHPPLSTIAGDPALVQSLKDLLAARADRVCGGLTFTTSSVVREVDAAFWKVVDKRCRAIEMSAAAFYAAARETGKRAAAYFWVTDLPTRGKSFFEPLEPRELQIKRDRYNRAVSLDIALLASL